MVKMCLTCSAMNPRDAGHCWNCQSSFNQVARYIDAENGRQYWLPSWMTYAEFLDGGREECAVAEWK